MKPSMFLVALLCAANAPLAAAPAPPAFSLSVSEHEVGVVGATPGQQVALFSVGQDFYDSGTSIVPLATIVNSDANGEVRYRPGRGVLMRSVWAAVDLKSGSYSSGHRPEFDSENALVSKAARPSAAAHVRLPMTLGYVFVARAGVGAWIARGGDGALGDLDHSADGTVDLSVNSLTAVGASPAPPAGFVANDVIFAIDTFTFAYSVTRFQ